MKVDERKALRAFLGDKDALILRLLDRCDVLQKAVDGARVSLEVVAEFQDGMSELQKRARKAIADLDETVASEKP